MPIPKIIHQTFFKKVDLPDPILENIEYLKSLNPGWEYRLYDDDDIVDFIKSNYPPEIFKAYQKINHKYGAARADFFRYLLIYKVGGAYFDIKSCVNKPLDEIIDGKEYVLSHWAAPVPGMFPEGDDYYPNGEYQNWHIIGVAGHPYLKAVIEEIVRRINSYSVNERGVGGIAVIRTTGPVPYTKAIHPIKDLHNHKLYEVDIGSGLVYCNPCFFGYIPTQAWGERSATKMSQSKLQFAMAFGGTHRNLFRRDGIKHYSSMREPVVIHSETTPAYQTGSADNMQIGMSLQA